MGPGRADRIKQTPDSADSPAFPLAEHLDGEDRRLFTQCGFDPFATVIPLVAAEEAHSEAPADQVAAGPRLVDQVERASEVRAIQRHEDGRIP